MAVKKYDKSLVGKMVKIVGCSSGHGCPIGERVRVLSITNNGTITGYAPNGANYSYGPIDWKVGNTTIEECRKELEELEQRMSSLRSQIAYMTKTGVDEVSDEELLAYEVLQTLESSDMSLSSKARKIASLFNQ